MSKERGRSQRLLGASGPVNGVRDAPGWGMVETEFRSGTPDELVSLFREMAGHVLQKHREPLKYLAGLGVAKGHFLAR